jgi:hypothetical protein
MALSRVSTAAGANLDRGRHRLGAFGALTVMLGPPWEPRQRLAVILFVGGGCRERAARRGSTARAGLMVDRQASLRRRDPTRENHDEMTSLEPQPTVAHCQVIVATLRRSPVARRLGDDGRKVRRGAGWPQ